MSTPLLHFCQALVASLSGSSGYQLQPIALTFHQDCLELLSDMHSTQQFLCIFSGGGACVNTNVRVRRSTVSKDFIRLASKYKVRRNPGEVCVNTAGNPHWIHHEQVSGLMTLLTHDRHNKWKNEKKRVCAENLPLCCACVKGKLRVNSIANSPDLTRRSCLKTAQLSHSHT